MIGGDGPDRFIFTATAETGTPLGSADRINNFVQGTDRIDLIAIDATSLQTGNIAFLVLGAGSAGVANSGALTCVTFNTVGKSNDYTLVYLDTDRDAGAEAMIRLNGRHGLTAADFML